MIVGIIGFSWLYGFLYPFPEAAGYRAAATAIFGLFFQAFDLGTANIMNRFLGEASIKDPSKMLNYIQYFIWYQMITGLIQTTTVSIYALAFVPQGQLGYAVWIMLIHSTTQYPGFLGVFRNILNTLQQYHRTAILNFISSELVQRVTEIVFVLLGRHVGASNPAIGEIMGIAIGSDGSLERLVSYGNHVYPRQYAYHHDVRRKNIPCPGRYLVCIHNDHVL